MAHETVHGHLSPPQSSHEDYPSREYTSNPAVANRRTYTPSRSNAAAFSYGDPEEYELRHDQEYYDYPIVYRTPPRPISGMQTRSGRSLGTPISSNSPSSRMSASPRPRRKIRKDKHAAYRLDQPLSSLAKEYGIEPEDMVAWVNRPSEQRFREMEQKHKNKVPRPMNSFMLYRMAYKNVIKRWGQQGDNNQMISSVAGLSWGDHESVELKKYFGDLAKQEKVNHTTAFPDYKFAPRKDTKKRGRDDDDDSDGEWEGSSYSGKRRRGLRDREETRSRSATPAGVIYSTPYHPSSYHGNNPHLIPVMAEYDSWSQPVSYNAGCQYEQYSPYHQQHSMQYAPTSVPIPSEQFASELVGLPPNVEGSLGHQMLEDEEYAVYPALGNGYHGDYEYAALGDGHVSHEQRQQLLCEAHHDQAIHPGLQTLAPADHIWSPTGASHVGGAFDVEFNRWNGEA